MANAFWIWEVIGRMEVLKDQARVAAENFGWYAQHRFYCPHLVSKCTCALKEAMKAGKPHGDEWFYKRLDAVRVAAGFCDSRERKRVSDKFKAMGLP